MTLEKHIPTDQIVFDFRHLVERSVSSAEMIAAYNSDIATILKNLSEIRTYSFEWTDIIANVVPANVSSLYDKVTTPAWFIVGERLIKSSDTEEELFRKKVLALSESAEVVFRGNNKLSIKMQEFYANLNEVLWNDSIRINPDKTLTDMSVE